MKNYTCLVKIFIMMLIAVSCDSAVSHREKPDHYERNISLKIRLIDSSGTFGTIYGSNHVSGASVALRSNTLGTETSVTSDSEGIVEVSGLLSDVYFISVNRVISDDEKELIPEAQAGTYRLINRGMPTITISPAVSGTMEMYLQLVLEGAPIVFSEIYASGPPGSGLYFHDKYVEFYNQTDSVLYLDGLAIARVYSNSSQGLNYINDPEFVYTNNIWIFPGSGTDYPIQPGQFVVCAQDAIDHRFNAPNSVDLSNVDFEFYKDDAPDISNPNIPNMIRIFQDSGVDWLIGGETDAVVLARLDDPYNLATRNGLLLLPYSSIIDGVEYLKDPTRLDLKKLNPDIDAGATGGVQFYTGRSMERRWIEENGQKRLANTNNSSVDFSISNHPTPGYHFQDQ